MYNKLNEYINGDITLKKKIVLSLVTKQKELDSTLMEDIFEYFSDIDGTLDDIDKKLDTHEGELEKILRDVILSAIGETAEKSNSLYSEIEGDSFVEMMSEGELSLDPSGNIEISYVEGEDADNGLEGTHVKLLFNKENPDFVTMVREGGMNTVLSFCEGRRTRSVYNTPYMPFNLIVNTLEVENNILSDGTLYLNYLMEIQNLGSQRTTIRIKIRED